MIKVSTKVETCHPISFILDFTKVGRGWGKSFPFFTDDSSRKSYESVGMLWFIHALIGAFGLLDELRRKVER